MGIDAVVGNDAGAYYNSATYATPTWVEMTRLSNVSINLDKNIADVLTRATKWTLSAPGSKTLAVEGTYLHKPGNSDTVFDTLQDMFWNDTIQDMFFSDDGGTPNTNDVGVRAHFMCSSLSQEQQNDNVVEFSVSLVPVFYDDSGTLRVPEWYEVS